MTARIATQPTASPVEGYAPDRDRPLRPYVGFMTGYVALVGAVGALATRRGRLPHRLPWSDLLLAAVATQRLSRTLAKGMVTSPVRAPFTRLEGSSGPAELDERPRGHGARKAIGELLSCPFCLAGWVSAGFISGFVLVPRFTRLVAAIFSTMAVADFLQLAYTQMEHKAE